MRVDMRTLIAVAALTAASALSAQGAATGPRLCAVKVARNVGVKAYNPNGSIRFLPWDKDSIVVFGRPKNRKEFYCGGANTGAKFGIEGRSSNGDAGDAHLVAYLPREATVSVKTINADITSEAIGGWFYSVSGNIRLSGTVRSAEAETMNGSLDINLITPWVKARGGNGHLLLRGEPQDADVSTISGTLSIATSSILRGQFATVSGDIHYVAAPSPRSIFEMSSHSGTVELLMPSDASAALALSTVSGPIENGFTRIRPISSAPRALRINLGRADAQVTVRTFKGPIRLRPQ
jgi:hypothetical protein